MISSSYDEKIKIWNISAKTEIELIQTLTKHKGPVDRVITLTGKRCASCSLKDYNVKLWNNETYEDIAVPFEQQEFPVSILQL